MFCHYILKKNGYKNMKFYKLYIGLLYPGNIYIKRER